jgi:dUTP pyrophosphatase
MCNCNQDYTIKVEVTSCNGKLPRKANPTDAGFDVFATRDETIWFGQVIKSPLDIRIELPENCWARIETKSGLGSKGMLVYAGVIDQDYRGVPHVIATNHNILSLVSLLLYPFRKYLPQKYQPIQIKKGEKIAQMTMNNHSNSYQVIKVEHVEMNTSRGSGGFGSTGK